MESLIGIIIGWLLGILGQRPIIYIQNSFKRPSLKKSIMAELSDLRCRLAWTSFHIFSRVGKIDKEYLLWLKNITKKYDGLFYSYLNFSEPIDKLLQTEDKDFVAAIELSKKGEDSTLGLKKFNTPFIDSNYSELHLFNTEFQRGILEIREQVRRINEEIDMAWFYFSKTFDSSLSDKNVEIVKGNLESAYLNIGNMAVNISKNISTFIGGST
jgi:hypothetical protein